MRHHPDILLNGFDYRFNILNLELSCNLLEREREREREREI
jgi:hypothetical protein